MDKILKTIISLTLVVGIVMIAVSAAPTQKGQTPTTQGPVIKKLPTFRGDHIPSFAEFRVQQIEYDAKGNMSLTGSDPYEMLINVNYITAVYRYEDAKNTDYSTLAFLNYQQDPILIRQPYKDVVSSIRKATEAMVK